MGFYWSYMLFTLVTRSYALLAFNTAKALNMVPF